MSVAKIRITQRRSSIGRDQKQRAILRGLGLWRNQQTVVRENTPAIRGMMKKVLHLLEWEEIKEGNGHG